MRISAFQVGDALVACVITEPLDPAAAVELMELVRRCADEGTRTFILDVGSELTPCAIVTVRGIASWLGPDRDVRVWGLQQDGARDAPRTRSLGARVRIFDDWIMALAA